MLEPSPGCLQLLRGCPVLKSFQLFKFNVLLEEHAKTFEQLTLESQIHTRLEILYYFVVNTVTELILLLHLVQVSP